MAVVGAIAAAGASSVGPGFVAGSRTGFWIVAACGLAVMLLGLASTTAWANATARRATGQLAGAVE